MKYVSGLAESINGLYKNELIHDQGSWTSARDVEFAYLAVDAPVGHKCLLEELDYTTSQ